MSRFCPGSENGIPSMLPEPPAAYGTVLLYGAPSPSPDAVMRIQPTPTNGSEVPLGP